MFLTMTQLVVAQSLYFHSLDQNKGLSDETNAHFQLDQTGFFWTSARSGISRFDGQKIKLYRPDQLHKSLDPNITSLIYEDKAGRMWFTCTNALLSLDKSPDTLSYFQLDGLTDTYYYAFHFERDSFLWLTANNQVYVLNIYELEKNASPKHACPGFVIYPILDENKSVKGLVRPLIEYGSGFEMTTYLTNNKIKKDSFFISPLNTKKSALDTSIFYMFPENDTSLWIPSSIGLIHFNPGSLRVSNIYTHNDKAAQVNYRDVKPWQERYLWVTQENGGLLQFDKNTGEFIRHETVFFVDQQVKKLNSINNLFIDDKENLWLSSFGEGIINTSLRNNKFNQLIPLDALYRFEELHIGAIVEIENNSFLVLVWNKGIYQLTPTRFDDYQMEEVKLNCCPGNTIRSLYEDSSGDIWIINDGKVVLWNRRLNTFQTKLNSTSLTYDILEIDTNTFLVSEWEHIYQIQKSGKAKKANALESIIESVEMCAEIYFDKKSGKAFLSQSNNITRVFSPFAPFVEYDTITGIGLVNAFFRSELAPIVWLASSTGLYKYFIDSGEVISVQTNNGLLNQSFVDVVEANDGAIWLSSYWGLFRYNEINGTVDHFTRSDGLITMQYEENVHHKSADGTIYFGGENGVTIIHPDAVKLNLGEPTLAILQASINENPVPYDVFINMKTQPFLGYKKNNLNFELAALEYSDPAMNRIQTFLLKNDRDTVARGESFAVNLANLQPARYRLDCYAYNSDGIRTHDALKLYFTINPPWYLRWWAISISVAVLLGCFYLWYRYRIRQVEKRELAKRREAEFKQREAEYKQLVAETETAVLRLQMNPHFIFNSMNSISSYIVQKDVNTAIDYLQRFAQLMRKILELSEHAFIDLEEEISFLNLYLEAESMRLGKRLHYSINTAPELDKEETLIPTMILQPFIENAIWHGISKIKSGGLISIRFLKEGEHLICEVEDNGKGRDLNKQNEATKIHKSKAIDITKKRLGLLFKKESQADNILFYDLKNQKNEPIGTRVKLIIPLID